MIWDAGSGPTSSAVISMAATRSASGRGDPPRGIILKYLVWYGLPHEAQYNPHRGAPRRERRSFGRRVCHAG